MPLFGDPPYTVIIFIILLSRGTGFSLQLAWFRVRFAKGCSLPVLASWSTDICELSDEPICCLDNYFQIISPPHSREQFTRLLAHQDPLLCDRSWLASSHDILKQHPGYQGSCKADWRGPSQTFDSSYFRQLEAAENMPGQIIPVSFWSTLKRIKERYISQWTGSSPFLAPVSPGAISVIHQNVTWTLLWCS